MLVFILTFVVARKTFRLHGIQTHEQSPYSLHGPQDGHGSASHVTVSVLLPGQVPPVPSLTQIRLLCRDPVPQDALHELYGDQGSHWAQSWATKTENPKLFCSKANQFIYSFTLNVVNKFYFKTALAFHYKETLLRKNLATRSFKLPQNPSISRLFFIPL